MQYPLDHVLRTQFRWVGREDMEAELRGLLTSHAEGLSELLNDGSGVDRRDDTREYVEIGMLPGTSGIGKVRVTLCHFSSVVDWLVCVGDTRSV